MEWLRADYRFDARRAVLCIPARTVTNPFDLSIVAQAESSPDAAEDYIRQFITNTYPTLAEACIDWMSFDYSRGQWEIGISHPSLARCPPGGKAPRIIGDVFEFLSADD